MCVCECAYDTYRKLYEKGLQSKGGTNMNDKEMSQFKTIWQLDMEWK